MVAAGTDVKIYDNHDRHVATISIKIASDGNVRYGVSDTWYMGRRRPRLYNSIESAIATTAKRFTS